MSTKPGTFIIKTIKGTKSPAGSRSINPKIELKIQVNKMA